MVNIVYTGDSTDSDDDILNRVGGPPQFVRGAYLNNHIPTKEDHEKEYDILKFKQIDKREMCEFLEERNTREIDRILMDYCEEGFKIIRRILADGSLQDKKNLYNNIISLYGLWHYIFCNDKKDLDSFFILEWVDRLGNSLTVSYIKYFRTKIGRAFIYTNMQGLPEDFIEKIIPQGVDVNLKYQILYEPIIDVDKILPLNDMTTLSLVRGIFDVYFLAIRKIIARGSDFDRQNILPHIRPLFNLWYNMVANNIVNKSLLESLYELELIFIEKYMRYAGNDKGLLAIHNGENMTTEKALNI